MSGKEIDRSLLWIKAQEDKQGNIPNPKVEEKAKKIEELKKEVNEGKLVANGTNDVLTLALGTPEHSGRVRGVGRYVNPSCYFNQPKRPRESIKEAVKKLLEEEREKSKENLAEECAFWLAKCEGQNAPIGKPSPAPQEKVQHVSEKASCNINEPLESESHPEINLEKMKGKECSLALGPNNHIVAHATIVDTDAISESTIHCVPLGECNMRVTIHTALDKEAMLPFPIGDVVVNVGQAVGTFVAWPKHLVIMHTEKKDVGQSTIKDPILAQVELPKPLKRIYVYARHALSGKAIAFEMEKQFFDYARQTFLLQEDILTFAAMDEIIRNCIVLYMR